MSIIRCQSNPNVFALQSRDEFGLREIGYWDLARSIQFIPHGKKNLSKKELAIISAFQLSILGETASTYN